MNNILICGAHSFVAKGLKELLNEIGYNVDNFSRGKESRDNNNIYGNYLEIHNNKYLKETYDVAINYAILKDGTCETNIKYIQSLITLCKKHHVKKLIHFSSIMVYDHELKSINEKSPIETIDGTNKKGYGTFKIAVDQYLLSIKQTLPFELILVRPGYVLADDRPCPFIKKLPLGFNLIKGNKKSKQPIVKRDDIHKAIIRIIEKKVNLSVYHFFPNNNMTKYKFAKQIVRGKIITLPKCIFKNIPLFLSNIGIIHKSLYSRFEGMYIESNFSSEITEKELNIKFK
jgi:nucleoside-diphosphate-sugar epimerase